MAPKNIKNDFHRAETTRKLRMDSESITSSRAHLGNNCIRRVGRVTVVQRNTGAAIGRTSAFRPLSRWAPSSICFRGCSERRDCPKSMAIAFTMIEIAKLNNVDPQA